MEGSESFATTLAPEQEEKVARIFSKFDEDKDGILRKVKCQPNIIAFFTCLALPGSEACVRR